MISPTRRSGDDRGHCRPILIAAFVFFCETLPHISAALNGNSMESVSVLCEKDFIKVTVHFDHSSFFGIVYTRPNRLACFMLGSGDDFITLIVPLKSPDRENCGVIKHDSFDTIVVDVRKNHAVEMITDSTFLVQCSSTRESIDSPKDPPEMAAGLRLLKNDDVTERSIVGDSYTVELRVPDTTSCVAFSAAEDIQLAPLIDQDGCPIGDIMTPFYPVLDGSGRVRAEMIMFEFNNSHHFHIQCAVTRCSDLCLMPSCPDQSSSNGYARLLSRKETASTMAATRVNIIGQGQKLEEHTQRIDQCEISPGSSTTALSLLLAILVMLTVTSCLSAWYNRPFRCQVNVAPRNTPYSFKHDFLRIVEEQITPPGTPKFSLPSPSVVQEAIRSTISSLSGRRSNKQMEITVSLSPSALVSSEYQNLKVILPEDSEATGSQRPSGDSQPRSASAICESPALAQLKLTLNEKLEDTLLTVQQRKSKPTPPPRKQSLRNSFKDDNYSILPSPPSAKSNSYMDQADHFPPPPSRLENGDDDEKMDKMLMNHNHVKFDEQLTVYTEGLDEDDIERARSMASTYMTLNNRMTKPTTASAATSRTNTITREYPQMGVSVLASEPHRNVYWFYDV